ncbi:hypothetical protein DY240_29060 [Jiangella rhizosphaerae]|uniref:Uncharacterized protein n=1 Tax=Jiangella rhizosphaerae TaxID=2293569 RepID=A0A418KHH8_9ACTN|nr:hypothetical protein DY240_29060 [Jiangella rhizosphaerae]
MADLLRAVSVDLENLLELVEQTPADDWDEHELQEILGRAARETRAIAGTLDQMPAPPDPTAVYAAFDEVIWHATALRGRRLDDEHDRRIVLRELVDVVVGGRTS